MDIENSLQTGFDRFFAFLPNLLGFLVLLVVGYIVAKIIQVVVSKALEKVGVDRALHNSQGGQMVDRVLPGASPSKGIGKVLFWLVFAFFAFAAIGALGINALTGFMNQALAYLPNIIVAIVIFVIAAALAGVAGGAAMKLMGDTPTGKIVGTVVPALIMVIATFMILDQLQIAENIVTIAFAATMFAIGLGLALAFGLGGRDVARRMLEDAYSKGREQKDQVKRDMAVGRERARSEAASRGYTESGYPAETSGTTTSSTTTGATGATYGSTYDSPDTNYGEHRGDPGTRY